ncbi:MAG TPA: type VI secretion system accessory protein TagJ [Povalibacter sp.]|nr:type VI secretion system accessory protein TagJ [Povalibacter sp.]
MSPEESVRAGNLSQALQDLQQRVRNNPGDAKSRIFLFQLLAVLGQWERAGTQLKVASDLDPATLILAQVGRQALQAEQLRARVFAGATTPMLMGEPAAWVPLLLEALRLAAEGHYDRAAELRGQALESAPATSGTINGEKFAWIADADSRLGPCLELIVDGKYFWVPFDRIRSLRMEAPADLQDVVWMQTIVTWTNQGQVPALIPTRYVGTESADDDVVKLSRRTDWTEHPADTYFGAGQRMLTTDAGEYPLLEVREIVFTHEADGG